MTTLSTLTLDEYAAEWDQGLDYSSAVLSGIVGDLAHRVRGGYHISIEDQSSTNYSVVRPDDKAPPGNWPRNRAAAVDMSMSKADMIKAWNRIYAVWANPNDPRRKYFNAFNGWNGVGSAERLDFVANTRTVATDDHKWHCHDEWRRRYVNDPEAKRAKLSALRGETIEQYLGGSVTATDENVAWMAGRLFSFTQGSETVIWAPPGVTGLLGEPIIINKRINQLLVEAGKDEARDTAMKAVLDGIAAIVTAGGGNIETAPIIAKLDQIDIEAGERYTSLLAELDQVQTENAELRAKLLERDAKDADAARRAADALDNDSTT